MDVGHSKRKAAWRALRKSARWLPENQVIQLLGKRKTRRSSTTTKIRTGFIPKVAVSSLVAQGWSAEDARQAVHEAILLRFPAFANSWDAYAGGHGVLSDLSELSEDDRQTFEKRFGIGDALRTLKEAADFPVELFSDIPKLADFTSRLSRLSAATGDNSAVFFMFTRRYSMHPELARAVMLHSKIVPWWIHPLLTLFFLLVGGLFVLAIVDPQNEGFRNVGGVGILHYTVLPLFALLFLGVEIYFIKSKPRFERAWREQLAVYRSTLEQARPGD